MAAAAGGSIAVWRCPSSSYFNHKARPATSTLSLVSEKNKALFPFHVEQSSYLQSYNLVNKRRHLSCLAVQESSTSTVESAAAETKEKKEAEGEAQPPAAETKEKNEAEGSAPPPPAAKPKPAAKAPAKPLPQLMEEDVIPSLRATLEAQQDISDLELSFAENKLEGSFLKKGNPYTFWAFFADGSLNGPKGFSLSSYGSGVSTVEPFLVDEKKPTAKHVVFWVEKRLAAQGIIPVWKK